MTCLISEVPYLCIYEVGNGSIVTVCDKQCVSCKNAESLRPEVSGSSFKITLSEDYSKREDLLVPIKSDGSYKVIGDVTHHNNKWYHKFINLMSFGLLCDEYYEHKIEKI